MLNGLVNFVESTMRHCKTVNKHKNTILIIFFYCFETIFKQFKIQAHYHFMYLISLELMF
jgi:hypothetical protein